jgi:hypothetical protein
MCESSHSTKCIAKDDEAKFCEMMNKHVYFVDADESNTQTNVTTL